VHCAPTPTLTPFLASSVSLIGTGQTSFGEHWDKGLRTLMEEAVHAALEDAPCTELDVDFVVVANMLAERVSAQAHLGAIASSLLPHRPPAIRVEAACASGSVAVHTALSLLESNRAQTVLVLGVEKMTDVRNEEIAAALMGAADSEKESPSGLTFPGIFGLIARRYMEEYGLTREDLSLVSARHHANAASNPFAQFQSPIPARVISESTLVADPLRLLDCSPVSDGAAACLLSTKFEGPVRIAASQVCTDTLSITERPTITSFAATREAAQRAFAEAQISPIDIAHVELHDCFSIAALLSVEDLGFAAPGEGIRRYRERSTAPTFNASGGLKACGHPVGATGVKQINDVAKQLKASGSRWGLAHNFGGAGATCGIHILEYAS